MTAEQPLQAHTINEVMYYLSVTPCRACGKGPLVPAPRHPSFTPGEPFELVGECSRCGESHAMRFICDRSPAEDWPDSERINPTDEPSRIVGLAQWLSLFYTLVEHATGQGPVASRRTGLHAALCIEEALKFYDADDEMPPPQAFLSAKGRDAFEHQPEKFSQSHLRAMRDKLPSLQTITRRIERDVNPPKKKWWQFWR
ncbi:MAG: hypothetical protein ACOCWV_06575 [Planctomycetota bacterium]